MTFSPEQVKALSAPLSPANVKERKQAGRKLSYIEGWHAIAEANRIFGFDAWHRETIDLRCVAERERAIGGDGAKGFGVSYVARVRVTVNGIIREGFGAGHGIDRDLGLAHESAAKEAETDAMKRALMTFGNPFGLALYDKEQANVGYVELEPPAPPSIAPLPEDSTESQFAAVGRVAQAIAEHTTYAGLLAWSKTNIEAIKAALPQDYYDAEIVERVIKPRLSALKAIAGNGGAK